jgi:predicted metal-binding membrane protein
MDGLANPVAEPVRTTRPLAAAAAGRLFVGVLVSIFAASSVATVLACASMSAMGTLPMPGGWTLSYAWTRRCGLTWPLATASFVGMWLVMMVAMMLPSLAPMLWRYRQTLSGTGATRRAWLTTWVGVGYFCVWAVSGVAVFALGVALAALEMQWPALARAVPGAAGGVVLSAGALQFSAWKARLLACCRRVAGCGRSSLAHAGSAWRHGVRHGLHCSGCCAGLTAVLLVTGIMDLRAMVVVTAAITAERVAPVCEPVARAIGTVVVGVGVYLIARAITAGLG